VGRIYPKAQLIFSCINLLCALVGRTYPNRQLIFSRINVFCSFVGRIYPKVQFILCSINLLCAIVSRMYPKVQKFSLALIWCIVGAFLFVNCHKLSDSLNKENRGVLCFSMYICCLQASFFLEIILGKSFGLAHSLSVGFFRIQTYIK